MQILTAADSHYFRALINLVGSLHYWGWHKPVVIYDLGMTDMQRHFLKRWQHTQLRRDFLSMNLPLHCRNLRVYAWKPVLVGHALEEFGNILWIDAGSEFRHTPERIQTTLQRDCCYLYTGQDSDMTLMSHPGVYRALDCKSSDFVGRPHIAGNLLGIDSRHGELVQVISSWCGLAKAEACIAPPGADLTNHRFDQTLLSILLYQKNFPFSDHSEAIAAHREQLPHDPHEPAKHIVHTARGRSIDYVNHLRIAGSSPDVE